MTRRWGLEFSSSQVMQKALQFYAETQNRIIMSLVFFFLQKNKTPIEINCHRGLWTWDKGLGFEVQEIMLGYKGYGI